MKHRPSRGRPSAPRAITKSVQKTKDFMVKFGRMREQLALVELTANGVFAARDAPMPTTPLALVVLLALMWHAVGKSHDSPETLNVGWLCEMMRVGMLSPSDEWHCTGQEMITAYANLDPEWAKTRPKDGWGPRLEPAPKIERAIQAIITGLNARLLSNLPIQPYGEAEISILSLSEEAQLEFLVALHHAGAVVIGMHIGGRLKHVGLVPGVESEDGAWWEASSLISTGSPHVLGVLVAGLIAELLPYALASDDPALRKYVFEDAEVQACAYDLALPDGGSDEVKVLAALEQSYSATYKMVLDNKRAINSLAHLLVFQRWASEAQCSEIISVAKSLPQ